MKHKILGITIILLEISWVVASLVSLGAIVLSFTEFTTTFNVFHTLLPFAWLGWGFISIFCLILLWFAFIKNDEKLVKEKIK